MNFKDFMEKRGSMQNKYLIKAYLIYLMKVQKVFLILLFIFHSIFDIVAEKEYLKRNF